MLILLRVKKLCGLLCSRTSGDDILTLESYIIQTVPLRDMYTAGRGSQMSFGGIFITFIKKKWY